MSPQSVSFPVFLLKDHKPLPPHASLSQWLTVVEQNYDIGNRELLALILTLQHVEMLAGGLHPPFCGNDRP